MVRNIGSAKGTPSGNNGSTHAVPPSPVWVVTTIAATGLLGASGLLLWNERPPYQRSPIDLKQMAQGASGMAESTVGVEIDDGLVALQFQDIQDS